MSQADALTKNWLDTDTDIEKDDDDNEEKGDDDNENDSTEKEEDYTGDKVLVFIDEAKEVVRCTCQTVRPWRNLPKHLANSHKLTNRQITEMMDSLGRDWKKTGSMWSVNVKTAECVKVLIERKKYFFH